MKSTVSTNIDSLRSKLIVSEHEGHEINFHVFPTLYRDISAVISVYNWGSGTSFVTYSYITLRTDNFERRFLLRSLLLRLI
jgi:hypothetical protein